MQNKMGKKIAEKCNLFSGNFCIMKVDNLKEKKWREEKIIRNAS
jgi:hypothetical protein